MASKKALVAAWNKHHVAMKKIIRELAPELSHHEIDQLGEDLHDLESDVEHYSGKAMDSDGGNDE